MGLNGFTEWLFSALLSWMQIIYNWFWSMLASGGQNEFMPWFSDNWIRIVLLLIIIGLAVDYTVYLMRWQPYHIWLNALRRARGIVTHPFVRERREHSYAGYRRVLEDDEQKKSARALARPERPTRVYAAQSAVASDTGAAAAPVRMRTNVHSAARTNANAAGGRQHVITQSTGHVWAPREDARTYTEEDQNTVRPVKSDIAPTQGVQGNAPLDAEGYVPESVTMVQDEAPMFSAPPEFARGNDASTPVYGRVYQGTGKPILPLGMDMPQSRPQVQLPDMPTADFMKQPEPVKKEKIEKPQREPAQKDVPTYEGVPARQEYRTRRSSNAQKTADVQYEARPRSGKSSDTVCEGRPSIAVKPAERTKKQTPRSISVRKADSTREMDFDDEIN